MSLGKVIYTDKNGNTLYTHQLRTNGEIQWSARNKDGRMIRGNGLKAIIHDAIQSRGMEFIRQGDPKKAAELRLLERKIMTWI